MNNYQEETLKEILKDVTIRCNMCHSKMIRVMVKELPNSTMLDDDTLIGYRCEDCTHYYLLDNKPV